MKSRDLLRYTRLIGENNFLSKYKMRKKITFLIALISLLTPSLNVSYAEAESHQLNFFCYFNKDRDAIKVSWERTDNKLTGDNIGYGHIMVRSDGPWGDTATKKFYPEHYQNDFDEGELSQFMAFKNDVDFDQRPSGWEILELPVKSDTQYYCAVGYTDSPSSEGDLKNARYTYIPATQINFPSEEVDFSVRIESDPPLTDISMVDSRLEAKVGDVITFTHHITQNDVIGLVRTWQYDPSKLSCKEYPDFRCEVLAPGTSAVSLEMHAILLDQSSRTIDSNVVTVIAKEEFDGMESDSVIKKDICKNSVTDRGGRYTIHLLGSGGSEIGWCRFAGSIGGNYDYEVLSGEAELIGMTEYRLTFNRNKNGRIKVKTNWPSDHWGVFDIGNTDDKKTPPTVNEDANDIDTSATGSFGSDCGFVATQPSKSLYHLELVNKNTKQRDGLCRVLTYRAENQGASTAKIIGMTEYSLDVSVSNGDRFTVYVEKDGEAINQYFEVGSATSSTPTNLAPTNTVIPQTEPPPAGYEDKVLTAINGYKNPFPDTNINELSGQAAAELYRRAVIGGYPDGEFKGYKPVNRAEAAKFLLLARFGTVADVANSGKFRDVLDGQWYTKFVVTAAVKGIINGHPDGSFKPADTVNTAEFLKMLTLTFGLEKNLSHSYADVQSTDWFAQYAGAAKKYNLFPNRTSQLLPGNELTREEVAVGIYQYLLNRNLEENSSDQITPPSVLNKKLNESIMSDAGGVCTNLPDDFEGLKLWLRADTGVREDTLGVAEWLDMGSENNDAFRHTNDKGGPELVPNAINGQPVLRFNENSRLFYPNLSLNDLTIFEVGKNNAEDEDFYMILGPAIGSNLNQQIRYEGSDKLLLAEPGDDRDDENFGSYPIGNNTVYHSLTIDDLGKEFSVYRDGDFKGTKIMSEYHPWQLGAIGAWFGKHWLNADIAELIIFDRSLNDSERESVQCYLDQRYLLP